MQITDIPVKFDIGFASSAGPGYFRAIPKTPTGTAGQASLQEGFPSDNFNPVSAGGVPPFGQDFNGILNQVSLWNRWQATGAFPPYDAAWQTAVVGYPKGSCVASLVQFGLVWMSLVDNNVTNPDTGGAGWYRYIQVLLANTDVYVNGSTGSNSNDGLSPATALQTLQAAIDRAFGFPPSQFTVTIHIADGTYVGFATPLAAGPNIIVTGNAATPSNVIVDGTTLGPAIDIRGPNTMTVQNLKVQSSAVTQTAYGFRVASGSTLLTANTVSGVCTQPVFTSVGGAIIPGNHTFSGNCESLFYSTNGGSIILTTPSGFTISTAIAVATATALSNSGGVIQTSLPAPSFTNPGNVTGKRYNAQLNGIINTQGSGSTYFPGTVAGTTSTGGQYA